MTNEANNSGVTRTYRDLATETTRDELDERILKMAAKEARPRYGIARAWTRPVAWAAMVGLSLVIVMQVNQSGFDVAVNESSPESLSVPPADAPIEPSSLAESVASEDRADQGQAADDAAARLRRQAAKREESAFQPTVARTAAPEPALSAGGSMPLEADAEPPVEISVSAARQEAKEVPQQVQADADAFKAADRAMLDEAEEQARLRSGETSVAGYAAAFEAAPAACDETDRASADDWYECIVRLRDLGAIDAADEQFEALLEAFPDFEEPPSK